MGNNPITLQDSPLSITSSIAGLLTFIIAISTAILVRIYYLRSADTEYFQVKASLNWYKIESAWLHDLVKSQTPQKNSGKEREYEMYNLVLEQLGKLEERLLELLTETEKEGSKAERGVDGRRRGSWALVPGKFGFRSAIAVAWLPVRTKALELVRQREALGPRVLFAQMSMISSRVCDQELRSKTVETNQVEKITHLEGIITSQHEKLDQLQDLVYRALIRPRTNSLSADSTPCSLDTESEEMK